MVASVRQNTLQGRDGPSHLFLSPTTLGCPKNILSSKSDILFFPPSGTLVFFCDKFAQGQFLAVFLTSRSNQKRWRHLFFSPTTLGCPKNILSSKSEISF